MTERRIKNRLVKRGKEHMRKRPNVKKFTGVLAEDSLLSDLDNYPHAFFIGCLMAHSIKAERAFAIPYELQQRIGKFDFDTLYDLSERRLATHFKKPTSLHKYFKLMSGRMHSAIQKIGDEYGRDTSLIWSGKLSSAEAVCRMLTFDGIGPKIATMTVNILARKFKIKFKDYYSIDISADVHVIRVFRRLGLTGRSASNEEVIYKARALNPEFPGMLDFACWEIGRNWCRPKEKLCEECYMNDVCPSSSF